jgi:hypothetical protein
MDIAQVTATDTSETPPTAYEPWLRHFITTPEGNEKLARDHVRDSAGPVIVHINTGRPPPEISDGLTVLQRLHLFLLRHAPPPPGVAEPTEQELLRLAAGVTSITDIWLSRALFPPPKPPYPYGIPGLLLPEPLPTDRAEAALLLRSRLASPHVPPHETDRLTLQMLPLFLPKDATPQADGAGNGMPVGNPKHIWMVAAELPRFDPQHPYSEAELRTHGAAYSRLNQTRFGQLGQRAAWEQYSHGGFQPKLEMRHFPKHPTLKGAPAAPRKSRRRPSHRLM